jgi:hypothetical protein
MHHGVSRSVLQLRGKVRPGAEEAAVGSPKGAGTIATHSLHVLRGRAVPCEHDVAVGGGAEDSGLE